ncbi:MAG: lipocalin-like domain-containing protein [Hyphomicrobiales bacterium]
MTSSILGTWRLLSWYNELSDGSRTYPLGEEAKGFISYSPDGYVFVQMMAAGRKLYRINDPFGGSLEEDAAAIKSQISYSGSYFERDNQVVHIVEAATCPNWVGTQQIRNVAFSGSNLLLSAEGAKFQGQTVTAFVLWEKASAKPN